MRTKRQIHILGMSIILIFVLVLVGPKSGQAKALESVLYSPDAVGIVSYPLVYTVTLDGVLNSSEWADTVPYDIQLFRAWGWPNRQTEPSDKTITARIKHDAEWIYLLYQIPWPESDFDLNDGAFVELFCFGACASYDVNDMGFVKQDGTVLDLHGWTGSAWTDDTDSDGTVDVEGAAIYDGANYWYEFRKKLDSGDGFDWQLDPPQVVGSPTAPDDEPHLLIGITDPSIASTYEQYVSIQLSTIVVNSTADPGSGGCNEPECTLREAIEMANAAPGGDLIVFNIPGTGPHTIRPQSALPPITNPVIIDGYSQPGASPNTNPPGLGSNAVLMIELDGSSAGSGASGLAISAGNSTIRGAVINRFAASGVVISSSGSNTIEGNFIGTDTTGTFVLGNGQAGVVILDSPNNWIGGDLPGEGNVLSANAAEGVYIAGASAIGNSVEGNLIGTDASGTVDLGNAHGLIINGDASNNTIGGTTPGARNVISGNEHSGVAINPGGSGNVVQGNYIGTNISGTVALGNSEHGVFLNASNNTIGGTVAGDGNLISGNGLTGIWVDIGTSGNTIQGNFIGTDVTGSSSLGNENRGVVINGSNNNTIGGTTPGARNIISGNGITTISSGVAIFGSGATGNEVIGNYIGTNFTGEAALGNSGAGVSIGVEASGNTIGGNSPEAANVISSNQLRGVTLSSPDNTVEGNLIGTDVSGTTPLGNNGPGVGIFDAPDNMILDNTIAFNSGDGVRVLGEVSIGNEISQNSIHENYFKGIENLMGGNAELSPPVITVVLLGDHVEGIAPSDSRVEIFADENGEGQTFLGTAIADGSDKFVFDGALSGPNLTATAIDVDGNTSEFSFPVPLMADNCEFNDEFAEACDIASELGFEISSTGSFTSAVSRPGDVDWFYFEMPGSVPPGSQVTINLSGPGGGILPANFDLAVLAEVSEDPNTVPSPLQGVPLQGVPLQGVPLQGVPLQGVAAEEVPLQGVPLQGVDVEDIPLQGVPLQGVPLQGVPLQGVPLQGVPLQGVSFHSGKQPEEVTILLRGGMTGTFYLLVWSSSGEYSASPSNSPYEVTVTVEAVTAEPCTTGLDRYLLGDSLPAPLGNTINPTTLILIHRPRMEALYGNLRADALITELQALATHEVLGVKPVDGIVIDLGTYTEVEAAYANWDAEGCDPEMANLVSLEIKKVILDLLHPSHYPTIENLVLVGNDTVIPFRRVPDGVVRTPDGATVPNEYDYQGEEGGTKFIGSVGTVNSPTLATLRLQYYLSDDFYADLAPVLLEQGRELSIPDIPIGRLVETPEDIQAYIAAFMDLDGVMGNGASITSLTTGYSFLLDQAGDIRDTLNLPSPDGKGFLAVNFPSDSLINDTWSLTELLDEYMPDSEPPGSAPWISSINAHFDHARAASAAFMDTSDPGELFTTGDVDTASTDFAGTLFFTVGCHSGFNFFDEDVLPGYEAGALDWPQVLVGRGVSLIGNWGFGYGDDAAIAYSEELMVNFARYLGVGNLGQALVEAKREYLLNQAELDPVHEKILMEAVFYGLPNWELTAPVIAPPSGIVVSSAPGPPGDLTVMEYEVEVDENQLVEVTIPDRGSFYELAGRTQAAIFHPVQPKASFDIGGVEGEVAHGVLFIGGNYHDILDFDPVITMPTWTRTSHEPQFVYEGWDPPRFWSIMQLENKDGSYDERLAIVPGQFLVDEASTQAIDSTIGTERIYETMDFEVFYAPYDVEFQPPIIGRVNANVSPNPGVFFSVEVRDPGATIPPYGILEVFVTYTEREGGNSWNSFDLDFNPTTQRWEGVLEDVGSINFFVQAIDFFGNVGSFAGSGYLAPIAVGINGPDETRVGEQVTFTAELLSPLPDALILWDFGDGAVADGDTTVSHTYSKPGMFKVVVRVITADGHFGVASMDIYVQGSFGTLEDIRGTLEGLPSSAFKPPSDDRRQDLLDKLTEVEDQISRGEFNGAIQKLRNDIRTKMDGCGNNADKNDWILDCLAQETLRSLIDDLIRDLEALLE